MEAVSAESVFSANHYWEQPCLVSTERRWSALTHNALPHILSLPPADVSPQGLLVTVHGISRNAAEHVELLRPWAARHDFAVLAPLFLTHAFPGYQRLRRGVDGRRPDHALIDLLDWIREMHLPVGAPIVFLGYSGGAQFAHRFLLNHPGEGSGALLAAAGWYTWPDTSLPFPHGVGSADTVQQKLDAFLCKPLCVVVGKNDTRRDAQLRKNGELDARQGRTRVARASNWTRAIEFTARQHGFVPQVELRLLANAAHSFSACMRAGLGGVLDEFLSGFCRHPLVVGA